MITAQTGILLAIQTADCLPVLADRSRHEKSLLPFMLAGEVFSKESS